MLELTAKLEGLDELLTTTMMEVEAKAALALEFIGVQAVAYLRSLTTEMRPPVRRSESFRAAHPGHWADVTGNLSNSYGFRVIGTSLMLYNTAEYAIWLEDRHGFYVLSGVMGGSGASPIVDAARRIIGSLGGELVVEGA